MPELDKTSDEFAQLNMYFIASRLFREAGNTDEVLKCNMILKSAIHACEENLLVDEQQLKASERLRLRACAMLDRLDTRNHLRRKAHRDLALWYLQLGKTQKSEKEKQALFELVGKDHDGIMHPKKSAWGHLKWWQEEGNVMKGCGMG